MALIVKEKITIDDIMNCIHSCKENKIKDILVFDVYRGEGVEKGYKSVALGLILQDMVQTLTETEIDAIFTKVLERLNINIKAKLRD
jgi:phenylalanyl-tRNA synthetase beta chain